jgi:NAD(P)-dependent dehydrogenase (short-subunit alcohol dehydrogenase family)
MELGESRLKIIILIHRFKSQFLLKHKKERQHMQELENKVAWITGSASGIGRGIAHVLANHGADMVIADVALEKAEETAAEIRAKGSKCIAIHHNVTNRESSEKALAQIIEEFGKLDILVNNVGVASQMSFDQVTEQEWDRINNINTKGTFLVSQVVSSYFVENKSGKIINIASFCGKEAIPEYLPYNVSKFGVVAMTQTLALELAVHNINVNAVCPGIVRTTMWDGLSDTQWQMQVERVPLKRGQTSEEIGEAVSFLASERARNITGVSLGVTGGLSIW